MSKYKVGDKVVLTITDTNEMGCLPCYVLNDDLILSRQEIDKYSEPLSTYTLPLEDKIHKQAAKITRLLAENERLKAENEKMSIKIDAYELCGDQHEVEYSQAFNKGAETAWELARKITVVPKDGGYGGSKLIEIFNTALNNEIFNLTYPEAAAKVAEWEKAKEEIKVGDIVKIHEGNDDDLCILYVSTDKKYYNAVDEYGAVYNMLTKGMITKTGRHIDIDSFLKQIGGNGNERQY